MKKHTPIFVLISMFLLSFFNTEHVFAQQEQMQQVKKTRIAKSKQITKHAVLDKTKTIHASEQKKTNAKKIQTMNLSELNTELNIISETIEKYKQVKHTSKNEAKIKKWITHYKEKKRKVEKRINQLTKTANQ